MRYVRILTLRLGDGVAPWTRAMVSLRRCRQPGSRAGLIGGERAGAGDGMLGVVL
jgi:hypothetical protein